VGSKAGLGGFEKNERSMGDLARGDCFIHVVLGLYVLVLYSDGTIQTTLHLTTSV
jgi:hypothetical protein